MASARPNRRADDGGGNDADAAGDATATEPETEDRATQDLLRALAARDELGVRRALAAGADAAYQDEATGQSALMAAARDGLADAVSVLLQAGAPWNAVDRSGRCAGDLALAGNHQTVVETLVSAGVAAELVFAMVTRNTPVSAPRNAEYLAGRATYENEGRTLLQAGTADAVMMEWERPLMCAHARALLPHPGGRVLNVGFGLGIIDGCLQELQPSQHTIVEAHPDVLARMREQGWFDKPNVRVVRGRWQDAHLESLGPFDGVFFDTFGEFLDDLREFHELLPRLLSPSGLYSFFNGMAPNSFFFQGVVAEVVRLELKKLGLDLEFVRLEVDAGDDDVWRGVARRYFSSNDYYLPLARRDPAALGAAAATAWTRAERRRPADVAFGESADSAAASRAR